MSLYQTEPQFEICTCCISQWCVALHILEISTSKHLAFRIFLRQFPCGEELAPCISKPDLQICALLCFSFGFNCLSGTLNTKSTYRYDFHVPSRLWVSQFIGGPYPTKLSIIQFGDNSGFSDPKTSDSMCRQDSITRVYYVHYVIVSEFQLQYK